MVENNYKSIDNKQTKKLIANGNHKYKKADYF